MQLRIRKSRSSHSVWQTLVLGAALLVVGVAAAACGGSPDAAVANLGSSATTTSTTPSSDVGASTQKGNSGGGGSPQGGAQQASFGMGGVSVQFAQCMRTHGVPNFPDPNGQGQVQMSGVNPQSSSFQAAQRACGKYAPNGGKAPTQAQQQQAIAQALKFSECMRSHGIADFPDPQVSTSGGGVSIGIRINGGRSSDLNPNSPQFQAAQKACQSVAPFGKAIRSASKS